MESETVVGRIVAELREAMTKSHHAHREHVSIEFDPMARDYAIRLYAGFGRPTIKLLSSGTRSPLDALAEAIEEAVREIKRELLTEIASRIERDAKASGERLWTRAECLAAMDAAYRLGYDNCEDAYAPSPGTEMLDGSFHRQCEECGVGEGLGCAWGDDQIVGRTDLLAALLDETGAKP